MTLDNVKNHRGVLLGLALVAMILLAYWPAMHSGGFIWDDDDYVINNKTLHDAEGLKAIWTNPRATPQYYPLVHTTYWMEYHLWELDPTGYHVTNVFLHAFAALLLWLVLRRLKLPGAWLAAALFALHPVHVESVAWITERKNVLSGVFYLGAALAYLKWSDARAGGDRKWGIYLLALILFVGALLSKTVTATLPAALLLVMWWKYGFADGSARGLSFVDTEDIPDTRSHARQRAGDGLRASSVHNPRSGERGYIAQVLPLAPFFVVGLALSCLTIWLEIHHVGAKGEEWNFTMIDRCLIAGRVIWFYAAKLAWPAELIFNYPRWEIDAAVWWQYLYPLSFAAMVVLLWAARKRIGRGALTAVLFFAVTLVPALGFFDVYPMRYSFVADHFQYHASIGLIALGTAILTRGWQRLTAWTGILAGPLVKELSTAALLVLLAALSWKQCHIYQGLETLWQDTIEKNPASWKAYNNLGMLYIDQGRPAEAIPVLEQATRYNPSEAKAYSNMGVALSNLGRIEDAIEQYRKAIDIDPDDPGAYNNMGAAMAKQEHYEEAAAYYLKALAVNPEFGSAHSNLGKTLVKLGRIEDAIEHHKKAVELMPDLGEIHLNYGEALHVAGRVRDAEDQYRTAASLDPSLAAAHINLGLIATKDQLLPAALSHFRRAVEEAPELSEAQRNLAKTLAAIGLADEAVTHFNIALELDPRSAGIRIDAGDFLMAQGDKKAALRQYLTAVEMKPGNPALLFTIGKLNAEMGNAAAAAARFQALLDADANHAPARNHLAVLLAGQEKYEEAVDLLRRAAELEPENAEFHNNLGVILVRQGKHQEALEALEEAVRLNPDYEEARKNLNDLRALMSGGGKR